MVKVSPTVSDLVFATVMVACLPFNDCDCDGESTPRANKFIRLLSCQSSLRLLASRLLIFAQPPAKQPTFTSFKAADPAGQGMLGWGKASRYGRMAGTAVVVRAVI